MFFEGFALRHFQGRPEFVVTARNFTVGRAGHDVAGEGIFAEHEIKGRIQLIIIHLPSTECAVREFRSKKGLSDTADHSCVEHRTDSCEDRL